MDDTQRPTFDKSSAPTSNETWPCVTLQSWTCPPSDKCLITSHRYMCICARCEHSQFIVCWNPNAADITMQLKHNCANQGTQRSIAAATAILQNTQSAELQNACHGLTNMTFIVVAKCADIARGTTLLMWCCHICVLSRASSSLVFTRQMNSFGATEKPLSTSLRSALLVHCWFAGQMCFPLNLLQHHFCHLFTSSTAVKGLSKASSSCSAALHFRLCFYDGSTHRILLPTGRFQLR